MGIVAAVVAVVAVAAAAVAYGGRDGLWREDCDFLMGGEEL